jgi:hypothetical protein
MWGEVEVRGAVPKGRGIGAAGYRPRDVVLTALNLGGSLSVRVETVLTRDEVPQQSLGVFIPRVAVALPGHRCFGGAVCFMG